MEASGVIDSLSDLYSFRNVLKPDDIRRWYNTP